MTKWFVDRVLPGFVGAGLGGILAWMATGIDSISDRLVERLAQNWLEEGSVLLVSREENCPKNGWDSVGQTVLIGHSDFAGSFDRHFDQYFVAGPWPTKTGTLKGSIGLSVWACVKE